MTKEQIIKEVQSLNLPNGSFIVFGSCPLAIAGLREANDIDLLVTPKLFEQLKLAGWKEIEKSPNDNPLTSGVFEAHKDWNFSSYQPTLEQLLASAIMSDGIPFAALEEVRKWKLSSGRPKDLADIALIDSYEFKP